MTRYLKHLNALRAFEAAARLGTFTRAAQELGVTPAAVGQQVRILEDYLGHKLFHRTAEGLRATAAASTALAELHDGFDRLESGFRRLDAPVREGQLSVTIAPSIAWRWLAPRMQGLYKRCPEIDLRMDTSIKIVDLADGEFDLAFRYWQEERGGWESTLLFVEHLIPVCVPHLYDVSKGSSAEAQMLSLPLLHIDAETKDPGAPSWHEWGRVRYGLQGDLLDQGPRYPNSAMAIQAALDGQGVALCGLTLVIDDLVAGHLVAPLRSASAVKTDFAYRMVWATARRQSATQKTFMRWIEEEAAKTNEVIADFLS